MSDCPDSHPFDRLTRESLDTPWSRKWSLSPGTIGAWVAEMDFGTAPAVSEALTRAVSDGNLGYLAPSTAADLADATAAWMAGEYGWTVSPDDVHSVSDVMAALRVAVEEYSPAGSAVIVPTPAYMPFLTYLPTLGREVVEVPGRVVDGRWEHDLDAIDLAFERGASTLVLCSPHNPTGTVLTRYELLAISEVVERHGGRVFADEIHAPLRYDGVVHVPYASVSAAAAAHTITGTSASKAWNIPGLKAAQLITSNEDDRRRYGRFGFAAVHGASTLGVLASTAAYREGASWLRDVVGYLQGNRDLLTELVARELPGVGYVAPQATYLAWLDFGGVALDRSPADVLRERGGVTLTDGGLCGRGSEGHARFVFAMPRPLLEESVGAMAAALVAAR